MCYGKGYRNEMQNSTTATTNTTNNDDNNLVISAVKGKLSGNKYHFAINAK